MAEGKKSLEDILSGSGLSFTDFGGSTITIEDYVTDSGQFGEFLVVNVLTPDGEQEQVTAGSETVVGTAIREMNEAGYLPIKVAVEVKKSRYGRDFAVLRLPEEG